MIWHVDQVGHWMSQPVVAASEGDSARRALQVMDVAHIHHMPVVDAVGTIVGILSVRDLDVPAWAKLPGAASGSHIPERMSVGEAMSDVVITVGPEDTIRDTATLLLRAKVHAVPVVNEHSAVVGLLTVSDVVRALMEA